MATRPVTKSLAAAAAALLMASAAAAMGTGMTDPPLGQKRPYAPAARMRLDWRADAQKRIETEFLALRQEGLKLRAGDGGVLTAAHRAYLQGKLDALNAEIRALK